MQQYGLNTHIFTPTYIGYSDVTRFGHNLHKHHSLVNSDYTVDLSHKKEASLIILANPNNPIGITTKENILKLVKNNPKSIILIDEAYGEFENESVISEVALHSNLVVVRSFSKGYSLAGYRIGYIIANPYILKSLQFETNYFNVSYTSVGAANSALENPEYFLNIRKSIKQERKETQELLIIQGFKVIDSYINAVV